MSSKLLNRNQQKILSSPNYTTNPSLLIKNLRMDPMYRNIIHSYPHQHQRDQLHCSSPFPYPGTETIPPQPYPHVAGPPVWCSSYGYMPPVAGHGCCNHYPFISPCAHHCPVSYPPYPIQYMPPSCYPIEQPRPSTSGPHCWGCANHPPQPVEQRNLRIEEEGSADGERRKNEFLSPLVWMPPDYGHNKDGKQKQEGDDGKRDFPLPLFWIPYKPEEKETEKHDSKDMNTKPNLDHVEEVRKHEVNEGSKKDRGIERVRDVPVKDSVDHGEKKVSEESVKRKSPPPSKSSKLPPVCLRVDPLPRKKTANGSSQKEGSSQSGENKSKILTPSDNKKLDKMSTKEVKEGKGAKTIDVVDGKTLQERNKAAVSVETPVNQPEEMAKAEETSRECLGTGKELSGEKEEAKEIGKRKLSEDEAAVVIQKVYRGFETRRWDPVKKLKEMAKLREEMGNVKRMIQEMESSSDAEVSCKQRTYISESILSLLLKVDSIQVLHPSIREVRKGVAKELVSLQEKLDALTSEKSVNSPQQESSSKSKNSSSETPSDLPKSDGALDCENSEFLEASPNREKLVVKPEKEDEKSNAELENDEASRKSCEEVPIPITLESHDDATDKENKEMHHELDLPLGEVNVGSDEIDTKTGDGQSEPEECVNQQPQNSTTGIAERSLTEQDVSSQLLHEGATNGEKNHEAVEENTIGDEENKKMHHELDLPLGETNDGSEEVDSKTGGYQSEPEEGVDQQPQNSTTGIVEPSLMSAQLVHEGTTIGVENHEAAEENANADEEDTKIHHVLDLPLGEITVGSEEVDTKTGGSQSEPAECADQQPQNPTTGIVEPCLTEQDMSGQLVQEGTTIGVENQEAVEENVNGDEGSNEMHHVSDPPLSEVNVRSNELNSEAEVRVDENSTTGIAEPSVTEQDMSSQLVGVEDKKMDVVLLSDEGEDGVMESNRKLVEENERLRVMMENLIRSGQEQVTAISRLTGRVKDLERRISVSNSKKKSKLKLKRGNRAHNHDPE